MPQVPYQPFPNEGPVPTGGTPQLSEGVPAAAFGVNIAQAIEHLGSTTEKVGDELWNRALAFQNLRNEDEVTQKLSDLENQSGQLRTTYLNTEGTNAVDQLQATVDQSNKIREDLRSQLSNDVARRMFDRTALQVTNRANIAFFDHGAQQQKVASINTSKAWIDSKQTAAFNAMGDDEFQEAQDAIATEVGRIGVLRGWTPEQVKDETAREQSTTLASRIIGTSRTDPPTAMKMYMKAREEGSLRGQDMMHVQGIVEGQDRDAAGRNIAHTVMQQATNPDTFLKSRAATGVKIDGMTPNFSSQLQTAMIDFEKDTGEQAKIISGFRTNAEQIEIRARHEAMPGGVEAHPAALPGHSLHEYGNAADTDGKFSAWLRANDPTGQKYGLFAGIKNDPNHVQLLDKTAPMLKTSLDMTSEAQVIGRARTMAEEQRPGDVKFSDFAVQEAVGLYRQNKQTLADEENKNINTIVDAMINNDGIQTLSSLQSLGPDVNAAWYRLGPQTQDKLLRKMAQVNRGDPQTFDKLTGMSISGDPDQMKQFQDMSYDDFLATGMNMRQVKTLVAKQAQMAKGVGADTADLRRGILALKSRGEIPVELTKDKEQYATWLGAFGNVIAQWKGENPGKQIKEEELRTMGKQLYQQPSDDQGILSGVYNMLWGDNSNRPIIEGSPNAGEMEKIRNDPRILNAKRILSDAEVKSIWAAQQWQNLYGKSSASAKAKTQADQLLSDPSQMR